MDRDDEAATEVEGNCICSSSNSSLFSSKLVSTSIADNSSDSGNSSISPRSSISGFTDDTPNHATIQLPSYCQDCRAAALENDDDDKREAASSSESASRESFKNPLERLYLACAIARLKDEMEPSQSLTHASSGAAKIRRNLSLPNKRRSQEDQHEESSNAIKITTNANIKRLSEPTEEQQRAHQTCKQSINQDPMNLSADAAFYSALVRWRETSHAHQQQQQQQNHVAAAVQTSLSNVAQSLTVQRQHQQTPQQQPTAGGFLFQQASRQAQSLITSRGTQSIDYNQRIAAAYLNASGAGDLSSLRFASLHELSTAAVAAAAALQKQQEMQNNPHSQNNHNLLSPARSELSPAHGISNNSSSSYNQNRDHNHHQHSHSLCAIMQRAGDGINNKTTSASLSALTGVAAQHGSDSISANTINNRRGRRRGPKKCRKTFGMERRSMWCTQCKWKKACSKFL